LAYYRNKRVIFTIGDLIDEIEFYMWCPSINTLSVIAIIVTFIAAEIICLLKLPELWERFRNIKLK
jgi:hypothetical protein